MENVGSEALMVGDRASAAGLLVEDGPAHRLIVRGEGRYGEFFNAREHAALPVRGLVSPLLSRMVTVRGTWTGDAIVDADATDGGRGIEPPPRLEPTRLAEVDGTNDRSDILRDDVLTACETIRGGALVAFVAERGPRGWFGLASAVDTSRVQEVLGGLLGTHLHIVPNPWSLDEIDAAQDAALEKVEPFQFGYFWDDDGHFRAEMVVQHVSPALASVREDLPVGILHVATWLRREE